MVLRELREGGIVAARYRLDRLLGEGGFALVWAATHVVTRKRVALKFLKDIHAADARYCQRFLREARAACAVSHPNVITIHDVFADDSGPLMVMDLLEGETLGDRLKRDHKLSLQEVGAILLPVIAAVETAHAVGVLHRDLKPDNIFLVKPSGPLSSDAAIEVKVLDFGIAKLTGTEGDSAESANLTNSGGLLGTPLYMSPEQALGDRDLDRRSDVWALGVILYECLAGVRPIEAETFGLVIKKLVAKEAIGPLREHRPKLPAELTDLVDRALTIDRDKRPTLRELYEVVARHSGVKAPPLPARALPALPQSGLDEGASPQGQREGRPSTHGALSLSGAPGARRIWPALAAVGLAALGAGFILRGSATPHPTSEESARSAARSFASTPESLPAVISASATTPEGARLAPSAKADALAPHDAAAPVARTRPSAGAAATKAGPPTVKGNLVPSATATSFDPGSIR